MIYPQKTMDHSQNYENMKQLPKCNTLKDVKTISLLDKVN